MQFAIYGRTRCEDDVLDSGRGSLLGNCERSQHIDGDVLSGDSTDKWARCEMNNRMRTEASERPGNRVVIPNVGLDQRHVPRKTLSIPGRQIVNDELFVACLGQ